MPKNALHHRWLKSFYTYMVAPCLPSTQSHNDKKVEIAAIHPDFGAAMPLSLMEYAGRFLITLTSFSLPV